MLCSFSLLRRAFPRVCAFCLACLALCAFSWQTACADTAKYISGTQWVYMPAGARSTYIGIHGGTVPVSLLASRDGTHMVALVGETGNDFLRTLKVDPGTTGALPHAPSETLSTSAEEGGAIDIAPPAPMPPTAQTPSSLNLTANATLLMAGTAIGAMPVIYATGHSFASLNHLYTDSLLFGLSEHSPLLEGAVKAPRKAATKSNPAKRRALVRAGAD